MSTLSIVLLLQILYATLKASLQHDWLEKLFSKLIIGWGTYSVSESFLFFLLFERSYYGRRVSGDKMSLAQGNNWS